jgi:transposase
MDATIVGNSRLVTEGVDTHLDVNVAAVLDHIGGLLGVEPFSTSVKGNQQLLKWWPVARVRVEGTGSYGGSLARYLPAEAVAVVEVDRPNCQERRARARPTPRCHRGRPRGPGPAPAGAAKTKDGNVEAVRALVVAKRSARTGVFSRVTWPYPARSPSPPMHVAGGPRPGPLSVWARPVQERRSVELVGLAR